MMRIGILAEGLLEWGGGIDFLRMICDCLRLAMADDPPSLTLLVPRADVITAVQQAALPWYRWLVTSTRQRRLGPWRETLREQQDRSTTRQIARVKEAIGSGIPVLRFRGDDTLEAIARAEKLDCLLPSFRALSAQVRTPWLGYLYDFQHRHLPHLFCAEDRAIRDARFAAMAKGARRVIVNSKSVEADCRRFLGDAGAAFVALPFGAAPDPEWLTERPSLLAGYDLPPRFFLVSNQFWTHKNHRLVFEALDMLAQTPEAATVAVVCTGSTVDERDRSHFPSLQRYLDDKQLAGRVHILGHIAKRDQIEIMKHAIAVVQPTLFEGGPGGGAVYDAVSLGVPALVSDIPVNRELDGQGFAVEFFDPSNARALADLMQGRMRDPAPARKHAETLLAEGRARRLAVGKVLVEAIQTVGAARAAS
jgi:glycosyltransferase involved in cell wall biosynthesis